MTPGIDTRGFLVDITTLVVLDYRSKPVRVPTVSNLQRYDVDGFELVIDTQTGESFATISGYARMVGLSKQAISKRLSLVNPDDIKTAEVPTVVGFRESTLIPETLITQWVVKDSPELATKMLQAGVRVFLHHLAGFKVTSEATQAVPQLPPSDIRLANLKASLEYFDIDISNPRLKQSLQDLALNTIGILPPVDNSTTYLGVAELAEQLGYSPVLVAKHRSQLGKYVVQVTGIEPTKEKRLVNGTYRPVNLYDKCNPDVVDAITAFFETRIPTEYYGVG